MTKQAILEEALTLEPEERHDLVQQLLRSLDEPMDPDIEKAWRVEVERRFAAVDRGEEKLIPLEEVLKKYRSNKPAELPKTYFETKQDCSSS